MCRCPFKVKASPFQNVFLAVLGIALLPSFLAPQTTSAYTPQFPLKQGWLGADTAASIPLDGRHRVLWLFSDTYVRQDTGTNRHGAGFVNNSLAIVTWNGYATNTDYYIRGRDQGAMNSVFPSPGSDTNGNWWYWVSDGFKYNGKVYVFLDRFRRTGSTMWSFQGFATDLAIMDNVETEANPLLWPLSIKRDVLDSTNFMVGVSAYVDTAAGYAYLWGTKTVNISGWNYVYMPLFRLPLAGLEDPGKVLTAQLRELELDGAVQRKVFEAKRPHVEYSLTRFGERLRGLILQMHELARQNCEVLKRRPPTGRFDRTN